ncbi:unnamed protein product [Notodromas monacha]|uniref:Major facilitator superfamily (MFS) profile domain-containing protein n=1 Tax=Notodromas monacha TaxID=399045 RepID=A0A7R9GHZ8_9CRUS|nr:unnamed protein product [Notodromas monacha]CAG0922051.1 unnamed protein product [Notodromas monacha]
MSGRLEPLSSGSATWDESASLVNREVPPPVSYSGNQQQQQHSHTSRLLPGTGGSAKKQNSRMLTKGESRESEPVGDDADYVDSDVSVLSQFHEDAISQAGFGWFQWTLYVIIGLGLAADTIELFVVAYVLPSAEVELCMNNVKKGWLGAITFFGMMIGGFVWGSLADRMGRRKALLSALTVNAVFGAIAAFMPTYGTFMTARLCSGIGGISWQKLKSVEYKFWDCSHIQHCSFILTCDRIGGSLPVVFAYFSEFMSRRSRGKHLSWLLMAWAIGGVFVALMAWTIIPRTGEFYGLSLWFPEYLKALKMDEYDSNVKLVVGETYVKQVFNGTLDNVKFVNSTFTDVTFHGIVLNHVEFTGCLLNRCEFSDVVSSRTFFKNSTLIQNHFADTDMYPYRFSDDTVLKNNSFLAMMGGCTLDFDLNFHLNEVFMENLIGQLALIPGTVLSVFLLDKLGRVKMICESRIFRMYVDVFVSSGSVFHLVPVHQSRSDCFRGDLQFYIYCGLEFLGRVHDRNLPVSFKSAELPEILGSLTFGNYIGVSRAIPMLTTAAVLLIGAIASIRIPETKDILL